VNGRVGDGGGVPGWKAGVNGGMWRSVKMWWARVRRVKYSGHAFGVLFLLAGSASVYYFKYSWRVFGVVILWGMAVLKTDRTYILGVLGCG